MKDQNADAADFNVYPHSEYKSDWVDQPQTAVYKKWVKTEKDENKSLKSIEFLNEDKFNFAFDIVDELAKKCPDKRAMIHISNNKEERFFTFGEISKYSSMTAN